MFKKSERLNRSEFSEYFKKGKKNNFEYLTLINHNFISKKVAVVVSKKVAKSAVKRNLIKRRIYARLRILLEESNYQGVLIVIVKPNYPTLTRKQADDFLSKSIAQLIKGA
jgi:ribonuclease P protein component